MEERVPEPEARDLWRRAAELQAEAERARSALPPAPRGADPELSLAELAAIAEAAGLHPDSLHMALAERGLPDGVEIRHDRWTARGFRRLLPGEKDSLRVERIIAASPERALGVLRRVLQDPRFSVAPEAGIGNDPLRDGVLVYRLTSTDANSFASTLHWADVRVLLITLRPEGEGTRLSIRAPLFRRGINLALATGTGGAGAAGGSWLGASAGGALAGALGLGGAALLAPAVFGAAVGVALGLGVYRRFYRGVAANGEGALRQLAEAVAVAAETGEAVA